MLVISMRTRRFHGIKTSIIWMRPGNAAVLGLVLAAFSFASTAFSIVSIVFAAGDAVVIGAVAVVADGAADAVAVNNTGSKKQSWLDKKKGSPCNCMQGLFF